MKNTNTLYISGKGFRNHPSAQQIIIQISITQPSSQQLDFPAWSST
jgi:hypothetical protein